MSDRTTDPDSIGLEAWLENTRIVLPLRAVSVRADITAGFADVEVDQFFEQNTAQPLDCRFLFPLPADAAAYRCEMHVNGRVVLAKVEERSEARKQFKKLKAEGLRAALAESERDNLFALQLGNIQPGDCVLMRFAYLQPVQRLREQRTLRVPVNPGIRYIPGEPLLRDNSGPGAVDDTDLVPDASRITPPRINGEHPDAAALCASVRLHGVGECAHSASSPSHPIVIKQDGEDLVAALATNGHLPDRDFVFTWNEKSPVAPIIRTWLDEKNRGLLEIRLPAASPADNCQPPSANSQDSSSLGPVAPPSQADPTRHPSPVTRHSTSTPVDVYFLLDHSGSMQGDNWTGACKALAAFVPRLHPDARVWLSLFGSDVRDYDSNLIRAGDADFGPEGQNILRHGTGGGTELIPALRHLGERLKEHSSGRPAVVLLITDGQVGDERRAVAAAKEFRCPIHLLGIAMTANDGLDAIAKETGGRSIFLAPGEDIPAAVERFAPVLRAPVATELTLAPGWRTADESPLRDLCDGDDIVIPISATPAISELQLTFTLPAGSPLSGLLPPDPSSANCQPPTADSPYPTRHLSPVTCHYPLAGLLWARSRIRHLDASKRGNDALAVAKEFNLLSRNAAFIAWDEAEKVPVAQTEIIQPAIEPALGSMCFSLKCADSFDYGDLMDSDPAPRRLASRPGPRKRGPGPRRQSKNMRTTVLLLPFLPVIAVADLVVALLEKRWSAADASAVPGQIRAILDHLGKVLAHVLRGEPVPDHLRSMFESLARAVERCEKVRRSKPDPDSASIVACEEVVTNLELLLCALREYARNEESKTRDRLQHLAELEVVTARLAVAVQEDVVRAKSQSMQPVP